jgi:hypothetical protein
MRGRLTVDKLNAALDDARRLVDARYRVLGAVGSGRAGGADRDRLDAMRELEQAAQDAVPGCGRFFSEADLADSTILRLDTAGKMLFSTLRHLGRLHEFVVRGTKCWSLL